MLYKFNTGGIDIMCPAISMEALIWTFAPKLIC